MIFRYIEEKTAQILKSQGFYKVGFNIEQLAESLDIRLTRKVFDSNVSGLLLIQEGVAMISYNSHEDKRRQRFTIAHEIGHLILHSKSQPIFVDKTPRVMYRNNASSTGEILIEREANAFAAALLMPMDLVRAEIDAIPANSRDAVKHLSDRFDVSEQAMSFRLSNLGYYLGS